MEKSNCFCAQNYIFFLFDNGHSGFSTPCPARPGLLSPLLRSVAEVLHRGFAFLHGGLSVYPCREIVVPLQGNSCTLTEKQLYPCRKTLTSRCTETPRAGAAIQNPGVRTSVGQGRSTPRRRASTARHEKILT